MAEDERPYLLLVDDHPENLLVLEGVLGKLDVDLVKATSGAEALKRLLEREFAVILLDVQMPEIDGFETAALIRERDRSRHTPIIFVTAFSMSEEFMFRGYELGAVDYIIKPIQPVILRSKVSVFVDLFLKTQQVKQQADQLRALERSQYELKLAEVKLTSEMELHRTREAFLTKERETARDAAGAMALKVEELRASEESLQSTLAKLELSNRELQDFASVAAHDLQEPLRKIAVFGDRLRQACGQQMPPQGLDYLERMLGATRRMQALINDLLAFSRVTTKGQPFVAVDLAQVVRDVVTDLEVRIEQAGGRIEVGELPTIEADPMQMRQLFQNLIGNALKFHKPGQPALVQVEAQLSRAPGTGSLSLVERCHVRIRDNGIGFEPKYVDRIFTVFQRLHGRTDYEGTGIGLAICRKIAERHGGTIDAESRPDEGATFTVTLPVQHRQEGGGAEAGKGGKNIGSGA